MAVKLEKIVKTYYDALEEGKILGRKCPECGNVEFPPVYACNECGHMETEWIEMSGKAKLLTIVSQASLNMKPQNANLKPYALGIIEMEEGSQFNGLVLNVNKKKKAELEAKLPVDLKAKIIEIEHERGPEFNYKTVVFEVVE
ncbi:MAG: zinc ribbon domain-containing protein [Lachnospiraceae bacterium]|nr:zinc ribbon domain-containing protein [Lachnospiraceae bacterium]